MIVVAVLFTIAFGFLAAMSYLDNNDKLTKMFGTAFGICFALAIGLSIWSGSERIYEMHDVTVRIYYLDGSQKVAHFDGLYDDEPFLWCRRIPFFKAGDVVIPCVSRFEIIDERTYEMTGRELRRMRNADANCKLKTKT